MPCRVNKHELEGFREAKLCYAWLNEKILCKYVENYVHSYCFTQKIMYIFTVHAGIVVVISKALSTSAYRNNTYRNTCGNNK